MIPLEKVPFATFYPLQMYLRGTCFFKNDFFKWTHILMFRVILCIQFYRLTQLVFSTLPKTASKTASKTTSITTSKTTSEKASEKWWPED